MNSRINRRTYMASAAGLATMVTLSASGIATKVAAMDYSEPYYRDYVNKLIKKPGSEFANCTWVSPPYMADYVNCTDYATTQKLDAAGRQESGPYVIAYMNEHWPTTILAPTATALAAGALIGAGIYQYREWKDHTPLQELENVLVTEPSEEIEVTPKSGWCPKIFSTSKVPQTKRDNEAKIEISKTTEASTYNTFTHGPS